MFCNHKTSNFAHRLLCGGAIEKEWSYFFCFLEKLIRHFFHDNSTSKLVQQILSLNSTRIFSKDYYLSYFWRDKTLKKIHSQCFFDNVSDEKQKSKKNSWNHKNSKCFEREISGNEKYEFENFWSVDTKRFSRASALSHNVPPVTDSCGINTRVFSALRKRS